MKSNWKSIYKGLYLLQQIVISVYIETIMLWIIYIMKWGKMGIQIFEKMWIS